MFKIQIPAKTNTGWRSLKDAQFYTYEKAQAYGLKYHTDRYQAKMFRVVEIAEQRDEHVKAYWCEISA